ncbi:hypothetical protein P8452_17973 [Trifolium repens]|nr:hypothetical protein P8452_17973 [Trifolium repens]
MFLSLLVTSHLSYTEHLICGCDMWISWLYPKFLMGKSLRDFTTDYNSRAEFLWGHKLIFAETYGMLRTVCNYAQIMRENINGTLSITCARVFHQFSQEVGRFVDAFNIIEDICLPSEFELVNEIHMVCTHPQEGS